jgi:hypothetical protein
MRSRADDAQSRAGRKLSRAGEDGSNRADGLSSDRIGSHEEVGLQIPSGGYSHGSDPRRRLPVASNPITEATDGGHREPAPAAAPCDVKL